MPVALGARLVRLLGVLEKVGLEALRVPHSTHLEGKLCELRVRTEGGIARGIYETGEGRRVVVLHVFQQK
ncbi:MAG: type II toxin-antitoxin system RelE/ParE family toxin [Gammaproteobacteria bacterium]|nr:type II toxin-antitoxin system RelE/ParE family toxin [Gammaproteobacteria bacterium]